MGYRSTRTSLRLAALCLVVLSGGAGGAAEAAMARGGAQNPQTEDPLEKERRYYESQIQQQKEREEAEPEALAEPDPEAAKAAEVEAFLARASQLIRDRNYDSQTTEHYRVQTDDPRLDPVAATALLESFGEYFTTFWEDRVDRQPYEGPSRVFLFFSYFKYNQLLTGKQRFDDFRTSGHYRPYYDVIVLHTDSVGGLDFPDTLVHEAAHQLIGKRLYGGSEQSHWVAEGMAAYFGYTLRDSEGHFHPGAIGGKGIPVLRGASAGGATAGTRRLEDYRRRLKNNEGMELVAELVAITDPAVFYGPGIVDRYSASWLLVHYLLHGEEGALVEGFTEFLRKDAAGLGSGRQLFQSLQRAPAEVDSGFRAHVAGLKKRPARTKN